MHATGLRATALAVLLKADASTVRRWLHDADLDLGRPGAAKTRIEDEELLELHGQGWSATQIAQEVGMSKGGVEARLINAKAAAEAPAQPPTVAQLTAMRAAGASWSQLALASGWPLATVRTRVLAAQHDGAAIAAPDPPEARSAVTIRS